MFPPMMTLLLLKTLSALAIACVQACTCLFTSVKNIFNHKANDPAIIPGSFFIYNKRQLSIKVDRLQAMSTGQLSIATHTTINYRLLTIDSFPNRLTFPL